MEEKIYFSNSGGIRLCGILSNPASDLSEPVIILCHGLTTSKDSPTNKSLQKVLNENNVATFRFDLFAHGESDGDFADMTITEAVDDILNAIDFLKEKGYSKIGLVGSSFGGIACIIAASETDDLFVLALKSPVSNYLERDTQKRPKEQIEEWKTDGFITHINGKGEKRRLNYTFFDDFKNNDGYKAAQKVNISTLIVHGDKDESVPVCQSRKIAGIFKDCRLEIIEDANHMYSKAQDFEKMLDLISGFIIEHS
ncbi:MAG: alpha/beta fold hydrolase [Candidatus Aenigmarchaeota archaeon]|nr:alpha/beta fold hydrolase [Candidatus Aenigmarchaeota archaeon]